MTVRSGVTLMIEQQPLRAGIRAEPRVRFAIAKHPTDEVVRNQRNALLAEGLVTADAHIDFSLLHGL
jgi:hypothetical protein